MKVSKSQIRVACVRILLVLVFAWIPCSTSAVHAQTRPAAVILDTDLGPDADDAGTVALLHTLADRGEATILGTVCNTLSPWCAPCLDAMNRYYGRASLPVGTLKGEGFAGTSEEWFGETYNRYIAETYPNRFGTGEQAPDALVVYRRILASQPDSSVSIVSVGVLTNLKNLLTSGPDSISQLSGHDLVARKVRLLSVMGGGYPGPRDESNFITDAAATDLVVENWPTPIMFSGYEIGEELLTGMALWTNTKPGNPVRVAYYRWDRHFARQFEPDFDVDRGIWPHSSYDQTALLYAVRGLRDYWSAQTTGYNEVEADGTNVWRSTPDKKHAYLVEKMPREQLARIIEDLMIAKP